MGSTIYWCSEVNMTMINGVNYAPGYIPPDQFLQTKFASGQEQQYINNLSVATAPGDGPVAQSASYTPEQAVALYNAMDPALAKDPLMAGWILKANGYFKEGQFAIGAPTA